MSIKIRMKKEVVDGTAGRRIQSIEGVLREDELPGEYIFSEPSVWLNSAGLVMEVSGFEISKWYPEEFIQKSLEIIRASAKRLHEINQKIAKLKAEWQGEETFII